MTKYRVRVDYTLARAYPNGTESENITTLDPVEHSYRAEYPIDALRQFIQEEHALDLTYLEHTIEDNTLAFKQLVDSVEHTLDRDELIAWSNDQFTAYNLHTKLKIYQEITPC